MSEKIKDFLIYYNSQRVILFPIYEYITILANNIIKDFDDWGLLENKLITQKEKYFKFFLEKEVDKILESIIIIFKDLDIKIFSIYKDIKLPSEYSKYFKESDKFCKSIKKVLKNKTKYFIDIKDHSLSFKSKGYYKNIRLGDPTGEDLEFLMKFFKIKD
jgi:hypothetical protein